jgi:hypothetical protein
VNLCFYACPGALVEIIMTNFMPLFTSVNSIEIDSSYNSYGFSSQLQTEYSEWDISMLASARILIDH